MAEKLRNQLIGAWKLVSYVEKPVNGSAPNHPMGERPRGIIIYTPDGYMSAQLMRPNRTPFASADWYKATPEEYGRQGPAYFAYSGPFEVDEKNETVTHSVFVSYSPTGSGRHNKNASRGLKGTLFTSARPRQFSQEDRPLMHTCNGSVLEGPDPGDTEVFATEQATKWLHAQAAARGFSSIEIRRS